MSSQQGPQGARRLKRIPFPPAPPRAAKTAQSPGGTLQADGRLRTLHGKGRVSARLGRAGEKSDFFSILLRASIGRRNGLLEHRSEAEVRDGIFEVGIQPLKGSHVRVGDVFHC